MKIAIFITTILLLLAWQKSGARIVEDTDGDILQTPIRQQPPPGCTPKKFLIIARCVCFLILKKRIKTSRTAMSKMRCKNARKMVKPNAKSCKKYILKKKILLKKLEKDVRKLVKVCLPVNRKLPPIKLRLA